MHMTMNLKNQQGITTFWGISVILMECVVVLFVFYILYFFWIENPTPTDTIIFIRPFSHHSVVMPTSVETTGWQIHQDVTYGFSFLYPSSYTTTEDEIDYNGQKGHIVSLLNQDKEVFWLRIFPRQGEESIAQAFRRLIGINPATYQSYDLKLSGIEATAYRIAPNTAVQDNVYFFGNNYFFESPFNTIGASILFTFTLIK
jgi:hypothetical protein